MDCLPYQHAELTAMVNTANPDGIVSEGFGTVRIRALEGRTFALEITEALSGLTTVAVLDFARPKRARVDLQANAMCDAILAASREDGLPVPVPHAI